MTKMMEDLAMSKVEGRWFSFYDNVLNPENDQRSIDFNVPKLIRSCDSKDFVKVLEDYVSKNKIPENEVLVIQFTVNCSNLANGVYNYGVEQVPYTYSEDGKIKDVADKMNDFEKKTTKPTAVTKMPILDGNQSVTGQLRSQLPTFRKRR